MLQDVQREIELLKRKVAEQNRKDKKKFAGLFDKIRDMKFEIQDDKSRESKTSTETATNEVNQHEGQVQQQTTPMEIAAN